MTLSQTLQFLPAPPYKPLTREEERYVQLCLAEECMEVAQRVMKLHRFGADEVELGHALNNRERLQGELEDLVGTMQFLNITVRQDRCWSKQVKIRKFMEYSRELGWLFDREAMADQLAVVTARAQSAEVQVEELKQELHRLRTKAKAKAEKAHD